MKTFEKPDDVQIRSVRIVFGRTIHLWHFERLETKAERQAGGFRGRIFTFS